MWKSTIPQKASDYGRIAAGEYTISVWTYALNEYFATKISDQGFGVIHRKMARRGPNPENALILSGLGDFPFYVLNGTLTLCNLSGRLFRPHGSRAIYVITNSSTTRRSFENFDAFLAAGFKSSPSHSITPVTRELLDEFVIGSDINLEEAKLSNYSLLPPVADSHSHSHSNSHLVLDGLLPRRDCTNRNLEFLISKYPVTVDSQSYAESQVFGLPISLRLSSTQSLEDQSQGRTQGQSKQLSASPLCFRGNEPGRWTTVHPPSASSSSSLSPELQGSCPRADEHSTASGQWCSQTNPPRLHHAGPSFNFSSRHWSVKNSIDRYSPAVWQPYNCKLVQFERVDSFHIPAALVEIAEARLATGGIQLYCQAMAALASSLTATGQTSNRSSSFIQALNSVGVRLIPYAYAPWSAEAITQAKAQAEATTAAGAIVADVVASDAISSSTSSSLFSFSSVATCFRATGLGVLAGFGDSLGEEQEENLRSLLGAASQAAGRGWGWGEGRSLVCRTRALHVVSSVASPLAECVWQETEKLIKSEDAAPGTGAGAGKGTGTGRLPPVGTVATVTNFMGHHFLSAWNQNRGNFTAQLEADMQHQGIAHMKLAVRLQQRYNITYRRIFLSLVAVHGHREHGLNNHRVRLFNKITSRVLSLYGWQTLDGYRITEARADASFDGLHVRGGVSNAITDVLVGMLCSDPALCSETQIL